VISYFRVRAMRLPSLPPPLTAVPPRGQCVAASPPFSNRGFLASSRRLSSPASAAQALRSPYSSSLVGPRFPPGPTSVFSMPLCAPFGTLALDLNALPFQLTAGPRIGSRIPRSRTRPPSGALSRFINHLPPLTFPPLPSLRPRAPSM